MKPIEVLLKNEHKKTGVFPRVHFRNVRYFLLQIPTEFQIN